MASQPEYDVLVVGGGMAGATLAIALAASQRRVGLVEAVPQTAPEQPSYDDRGLVLSVSSQRVLKGLGLWDSLQIRSHPVRQVHVSDQRHFGCVRLRADALGMSVLGHVVQAQALGAVLQQTLSAVGNIDFICPARVQTAEILPDQANLHISSNGDERILHTRLLVAADGSRSPLRQAFGIEIDHQDYNQTAIVSSVTPERPHHDTAFERFNPNGPLALLPLNANRCVLVFTVPTAQATEILDLPDDAFLARVQQAFGRRLGCLQEPGPRKSYPLHSIIAKEQVRERLVVLGNAAHTLHPNGAQGFNLCLRDIAGLAEVLLPVLRQAGDPGLRRVLNLYRDLRKPDQAAVHQFTHGLASLFYNEIPHKVMFRNSMMLILEMMPPLKNRLALRAMGLTGKQPRLVRGVTL